MPLATRITLFFLYVFAAAAPVSLSVGSIAAGGLILAGLFRLAIDREARAQVPRTVAIALVAWLAWMILATLLSGPYGVRLDTLGDETWIKLLVPTIAAAAFTVPRHVGRALLVYLGMGTLMAIYGIYQHFTGDQFFDDAWIAGAGDRWHAVGAYGHHLSYGGHVVGMWLLAIAYTMARRGSKSGVRFALLVVAGLLISLAFLWSHARSAQIGGAVGLIAIACFLPRPSRRVVFGLLVVMTIASALAPTTRDRFREAFDPASEETRLNLWRATAAGISDHPWTGYGVGNFRFVLREHEVQGYYESRAHAHNDLLMLAVTTGVPGALLFLGFLVALGLETARAARRGGPFAWVVIAALGTHVALTVGGLFQVYLTDDEVELTIYFLLGCAFAVASHRQADSARTTWNTPKPASAAHDT